MTTVASMAFKILNLFDFCRATLCVSAVLAVGRCLSVCLSHSCIVSKRLKISSHFSQAGSSIILTFESKRRYKIPRGIPCAGALKTLVQKNRNFGQYLAISSKRYMIYP